MSFALSLMNPPSGSAKWWAEYAGGWNYSGWLDVGKTWSCPYGAYGETDLEISVFSASWSLLHEKKNLGPIYNNKQYIYNCSTGKLTEMGYGGAAIAAVDVPASAAPGSQVAVTVKVKNTGSQGANLAVTTNIAMTFSPSYAWAAAGGIQTFKGYFTMPSYKVTANIVPWWWDYINEKWTQGQSVSITVTAQAATPEFQNFGIKEYIKA